MKTKKYILTVNQTGDKQSCSHCDVEQICNQVADNTNILFDFCTGTGGALEFVSIEEMADNDE